MMVFDPLAYINEPRWMESRLGLNRIVELLDRLDNPQHDLRIVHVAGTNGKGSVCAFLAQILQTAGYKTGLFTSPYIVEFTDRIRVDGHNISQEELLSLTLLVKQAADSMEDHPTEFELMTALAFLHFARKSCEIVVCEVGLGGRLDSTNVIEKPEVCVISSIGLDHTSILGTTLSQIASEKAGIIKQGVSVVSWPQEEPAQEVIEQRSRECNASLVMPDFSRLKHRETSLADRRTLFDYEGYESLSLGLLGSFQPYNAALAIAVIEVLRKKEWMISDEALRKGLSDAYWPGRFEIVAENPYFIIDGAHNSAGIHALISSLTETFPEQKPLFILGVLEDKDYAEMLEELVPYGKGFAVIEPPNARALSAEKLARAIRWTGQDLMGCSACTKPYLAHDIPDAVRYARELAGDTGLVCAVGSLYSVAALKSAVEREVATSK